MHRQIPVAFTREKCHGRGTRTRGIAIIGAVFLAAQHHATATGASPAHAFASGYSHGLAVAALLAIVGSAIGAFTIMRPPRRAQ